MTDVEIVLEQVVYDVEILTESNEIVFEFPGPQGPPGTDGSPGTHYTHTQGVASTTWFVNHNLGFQPNVAVIVDSEDVSDGVLVTHTDVNALTVTSDVPIAGEAECS